MIGGAIAPNIYVLYVFRLVQGFGLGALLVVLFAGFTEYVPGRNRGVWSSRNSFIGNWAHRSVTELHFDRDNRNQL